MIEHLSPLGRDIAELIGFDSAYKFLEEYGGLSIMIPPARLLTEDHKIVDVIGWEAAQKLCQRYGGTDLRPPRMRALKVAMRNLEIAESGASHSAMDIARKYDVTIRHAFRILAEARELRESVHG